MNGQTNYIFIGGKESKENIRILEYEIQIILSSKDNKHKVKVRLLDQAVAFMRSHSGERDISRIFKEFSLFYLDHEKRCLGPYDFRKD